MLELATESYDKVRKLVNASQMRGHLALVYAVLDHHRGQVFVDNLKDPLTAITCGSSGFFFAFGEPNDDLIRQVIERFWTPHEDPNYTTLFGSRSDWEQPLRRAFSTYPSRQEPRLAFEQHFIPAMPKVPAGFTLEPITASLAQSIMDGSGTYHFGIDPWFIRTAGGPKTYASYDLGLALVKDGCIASLCGVCGMGGGEVELEVGTVPSFRGLGLATIVSAAFIHQCMERNLRPAYSCTLSNRPSIAVAHKLGFRAFETVHGYTLFQEEA